MERLEQLAGRIAESGGRALPVRCDVTEPDQVRALAAAVDEEFGRCDVLVNDAGVPGGGRFDTTSIEDIERIVRVNLLGVLNCTSAFLPLIRRRRGGHIVNVASLAGRYATPGAAVYSATKHGVVAFSEALYHELHREGILVTAVNPAFVRTEGFPFERTNPRLVMRPERIARAIVKVLREGRAPEYSVPRFLGAFQLFRVLAPGPYRWGVRLATPRIRKEA
jgi:short-subunit dehydrogenase